MTLIEHIKRDREAGTDPKHGKWPWFGNRDSLYLATVSGGRRYVMDFVRKGMRSAQPRFQVSGIMYGAIDDLTEYAVGDGTARGQKQADADPTVYRMDICSVDHPDARRIARVPDLEAALLAADELACRAASAFRAQYAATKHIDGAKAYFEEDMALLSNYYKATEAAE